MPNDIVCWGCVSSADWSGADYIDNVLFSPHHPVSWRILDHHVRPVVRQRWRLAIDVRRCAFDLEPWWRQGSGHRSVPPAIADGRHYRRARVVRWLFDDLRRLMICSLNLRPRLVGHLHGLNDVMWPDGYADNNCCRDCGCHADCRRNLDAAGDALRSTRQCATQLAPCQTRRLGGTYRLLDRSPQQSVSGGLRCARVAMRDVTGDPRRQSITRRPASQNLRHDCTLQPHVSSPLR